MPKALRYKLSENREKVINALKADEYISSLTKQIDHITQEEVIHIYNIPFSKVVVSSSCAISVFHLGERVKLDKYDNLYLWKGILYCAVFYQDPDTFTAIEKCYEITEDIKETLREYPDIDNLVCGDAKILLSEMKNSMFTHVLIMKLETSSRSK